MAHIINNALFITTSKLHLISCSANKGFGSVSNLTEKTLEHREAKRFRNEEVYEKEKEENEVEEEENNCLSCNLLLP
jgi:hypothetical protein